MDVYLNLKQTKSLIGQPRFFVSIIKGLGLKGVGSSSVVPNTPSFRGAVKKVIHLLKVEL